MQAAAPMTSVARPTQSSSGLREDGVLNVHVPLRECLLPWFDVFRRCSTHWGLVTDVKEDGTTYERHGIVVELRADISDALGAFDTSLDWKMRRIRQAIDLVKLTLAVNPHAVIPLMLRRSTDGEHVPWDKEHGTELDKEALEELTRGDAPFELRMCLEIRTKKVERLDWTLLRMFVCTLDSENVKQSRMSPSVLRNYLVSQARAKPSSSRLVSLPIQTTVYLDPITRHSHDEASEEEQSWESFMAWAATTQKLHEYQENCVNEWEMEKNLAPLEIVKIELDLEDVVLANPVMDAVQQSMDKGIPVSCCSLTLDCADVRCDEDKLDAFLIAITTNKSDPLMIQMCSGSDEDEDDDDDDDTADPATIAMVLRCIGRLRHDIDLSIGQLLADCSTWVTQEAVIHGLLDSITTRDCATELSFDDCELDETVVDDLAHLVRHHAGTIREVHRQQKRRLKSLNWAVRADGATEVLRALLRALDDVEEIKLEAFDEDFTDQDMKTILRYPSLRSLEIYRPAISTMNIFHSSRTRQELPALKRLVLDGLTLDDGASMIRFIRRLDPDRRNPSLLASTLEELSISESDDILAPTEGRGGIHQAVSAPGAGKTLRHVLTTNRVLQSVNFLGDFSQYPLRLATGPFKRPAMKGHVPAREERRSEISKARYAAFLSAVHDGDVMACHALDSNAISLIFDFAAPHARRCIRI